MKDVTRSNAILLPLFLMWCLAIPQMTHATERARPVPDGHGTVAHRVLENGLTVVWEEDHRQPIVALEVRIKGGLRGEGRWVGSGITHFIEHMLFKGTPSRPAGTLEQEVRRYGGTINAFTSVDMTGVSLFVESRSLREALGLLADVLQHTQFDPAELEKERAVIVSEIQMNLDDPDRRLLKSLWQRAFLEHPYRHPILGYPELLARLTSDDLKALYASQYQPQQVVVACVGDLDGARLGELAQEAFGSWPRGIAEPLQSLVPQEPPLVSAREEWVELPLQHAYAMAAFPSTRLTDPEVPALDVLANILGQGQSSRLYETVVRRRQLAHGMSAWNDTPYDPGLFAIQCRTDPEKFASAREAMLEIIAEVKRRGVSEAELAKAKRSLAASYLFGRQTVEAKAGDLANAMMLTGDPLFSRAYVERIEQVTREQVQEAAVRTLDPSRMVTVVLGPRPAVPTPPSPEAASHQIPVTKATLDNGLTTLIGVDRTLPIAAIVVAFHGGVRGEPEGRHGLSNLAAQLLTKGTARREAREIALYVESLGAGLQPFSGRDSVGLSLHLLAKDLDAGIGFLYELITEATFPEAELALARELIAKQLQSHEDEIFQVGGRLLRRTLFGEHPYRVHPLGEAETIPTLTREECAAFVTQWMVGPNGVVAVLGDVDEAAVAQRLRQTFGRLAAVSSPWTSQVRSLQLSGLRTATQPLEKTQALIMLGFPGGTHRAEDRYALDVMTAVLSGMAGRLFQAVRETQGLSYTLGAVHAPGWDPGYVMVYAATRPTEEAAVLKTLNEQLRFAVAEGFTEEEVQQAKQYLIGANRMELQHVVELTKRAALDELNGVGFDEWRRYEEAVAQISPSQVHEAAQRYLTMDRHVEVIVSPNGHDPDSH